MTRLLALALLSLLSLSCAEDSTPPAPDSSTAGSPSPDADAGMSCGVAGELVYLSSTDLSSCDWYLGSIHVPDLFAPTIPLARLRGVDGSLTFFRPHHLRDFSGLDQLERVGGEFSIRLDNSSELVSLDGLQALAEVGSLTIDSNYGLRNISALSGLKKIQGDVKIRDNPALSTADVQALLAKVAISGTVTVEGNGP